MKGMGMKQQKSIGPTKSTVNQKPISAESKGEMNKTPLPSCSLATPLSSTQNSKQNIPLRNCLQKKLLSKCSKVNGHTTTVTENHSQLSQTQNVNATKDKLCKANQKASNLDFSMDGEPLAVEGNARKSKRLEAKRLSRSPYVVVSNCQKPKARGTKGNKKIADVSKRTSKLCGDQRGKTSKQTKQSERKVESDEHIPCTTSARPASRNRGKDSANNKENAAITRSACKSKGQVGKKHTAKKEGAKNKVSNKQETSSVDAENVFKFHIIGNIQKQTSNHKDWTEDEVLKLKRLGLRDNLFHKL